MERCKGVQFVCNLLFPLLIILFKELFYGNPGRWNTPFRAQIMATLGAELSKPQVSHHIFAHFSTQNGV